MRRLLLSLAFIAATAGLAVAQGQPDAAKPARAVATFAGGCFWCVEADFDKVSGVLETISGYTGGHTVNPTYRQVSAGGTGHAEAVQVVYDPDKVSYAQLLDVFWRHVDPTVENRQFCDVGDEYRTAVFVKGAEERQLAEASKKKVAATLGKHVYTQIADAGPFYKAEDYHQDFYKKNELKYKFYRWNCGRDQRLQELWGPHKGDT